MFVYKFALQSILKAVFLSLVLLIGLHAQDYPNKPIRIIVPTPPGAGPDSDLRQMAPRLSQILGQPVVIELSLIHI